MNDQSRMGHSNRNHQFDAGIGRLELMQKSESPQVQQKLMLQQLSQEIVKSQRIRYKDSELHFRHRAHSPTNQSPLDQQVQNGPSIVASNTSATKSPSTTRHLAEKPAISRRDSAVATTARTLLDSTEVGTSKPGGRNCQVCLIKAVRQDLMNINKVVQERNEQISKLLDPILSPAR